MEEKGSKELGKRVRSIRKSYDLTQEKLAESAECSPRYLGKIENAQVNPSFLLVEKIIVAGFKMTIVEFYNYEIPNDEK